MTFAKAEAFLLPMIKETLIGVITLASTVLLPLSNTASLLAPIPESLLFRGEQEIVLAEKSLDLTIRSPEPQGNQGFADNILLALHYLKENVENPKIDWDLVRKPFEVSFILQPGEVFAFHANVLPEFKNPAYTMNSKFFTYEGYKAVYGLGGNGVCHLASLMNWAASEADLEIVAKANHNFAPVPGVPKEFGTSIRSQDKNQNLYIENSFDFPVTFEFKVNNKEVYLKIFQ